MSNPIILLYKAFSGDKASSGDRAFSEDNAFSGDRAFAGDRTSTGDIASARDNAFAGDKAFTGGRAFSGDIASARDRAFAGDIAFAGDKAFAGDIASSQNISFSQDRAFSEDKASARVRTLLVIILFILLLPVTSPAAQGIRILTREATLTNDSLHLSVQMDLSAVVINRHTAVYFTPTLGGSYAQLSLAPVVLSGKKRYRFDRREWALRVPGEEPVAIPYSVLIQTRRHRPDIVNYHVRLPYSPWMRDASLLLSQEVKDCCELEWLVTDTLARRLSDIAPGLPETMDYAFAPSQPAIEAPVEVVPVVTPVPAEDPVEQAVEIITNPVQDTAGRIPELVPDEEPNTETIILYIDYPVGKDEVFPYFSDNRRELLKLSRIFNASGSFVVPTVKEIQVCGYCSPEGTYASNERLAASRARFFAEYLHATYRLQGLRIVTSAVPEDWEGLCDLIHDDTPWYADRVLDIIRTYGVFSGRERKLMELDGGIPYRDMLRRYFPLLRRIEVKVLHDEEVKTLPDEDSEALHREELQALPAEEAKALPAEESEALHREELKALPDAEAEALPAEEAKAFYEQKEMGGGEDIAQSLPEVE